MKKTDRNFLFWIIATTLVLRLFKIGSQSLWLDELLTVSMSDPKPGLTFWDYAKYNIHGPLHSFIVYLFHLVSMSDVWLRLPSALAGVGAVYYFYRWIDLWLGRRTAQLASILLVVQPLHIYYSQEVRNYSMLFFFSVFSSYYLHRLLVRESSRNFIGYVAGIAAGALCNFSSAFLYVVHSLIFLLRRGTGKQRILRWVIVSLAILVIISPWVYRIYTFIDVSKLVTPVMPGEISTGERLRGETTITAAVVPYTFYTFSVGFSMGPSLRELHGDATFSNVLRTHAVAVGWVAMLFGGLFLFGLYRVVRGDYPAFQIALYLFVPLVLTLALCWQNAKAFNTRYVLLSLPVYLCVLAVGIEGCRGSLSRVLLVLVVGTSFYSLGNYYFNGRYARADVRMAALLIKDRAEAGDCILAPTVTEVFEHYYGEAGSAHKYYAPAGTPRSKVDAQLEPLFARCDTLWYVRARAWADDPDGYLLSTLDARYERSEVIVGDGVTVYLYRR